MWTAFPSSDYYGGSAPPHGPRPTTSLPAAALAARPDGRPRGGSHVHHVPIDGGGAQLFPGSLAVSTPQSFLTTSLAAFVTASGDNALITQGITCCIPAPIRQI
jgi:hypothetical protein